MSKLVNILIALLMITSCSNRMEVGSYQEYLQWISKPENGLVHTKEVNGVQLSVKYLPPLYLAYKEFKNNDFAGKSLQNLLKEYEKGQTFVLSIRPSDESGGDIIYKGVGSYEDFKSRILNLNFNIADKIYLSINGRRYNVSLSNMESLYGLKNSRDINLLFLPVDTNISMLENTNQLDLVFEDDLFFTGINHFVFDTKKIINTPIPPEIKKYL